MKKLDELLDLFPNSKEILIAVEEKDSFIIDLDQVQLNQGIYQNNTENDLVDLSVTYKGVTVFFVNKQKIIESCTR